VSKQWGAAARGRAAKGKGGSHRAGKKWGESQPPKGLFEWIFGPSGKHGSKGKGGKNEGQKKDKGGKSTPWWW
jgi:hypothetical protein